MMSMNFVFGFAAAYMNGFVTGPVVTYYLGGGYGGYLASITAAVAGILSIPNVLGLVKPEWKRYYMIGGPICFGLVGLLPLAVGYDHGGLLGGKGLILLYVLQGLGRGVWESTNKAIFLD